MTISRREWLFALPSLLFAAERTALLEVRGRGGRLIPVRSPSDWKKKTLLIRAAMEEVMGPLPRLPEHPPSFSVIEERPFDHYVRRKILYSAESDDPVPAFLLLPTKAGGRLPAMVCLHQTTKPGKEEPAGISGNPDLHYAHELAERGYVALAPDYPNFGEYRLNVYDRGYASATMKGIVNHMRAVDLLASIPQENLPIERTERRTHFFGVRICVVAAGTGAKEFLALGGISARGIERESEKKSGGADRPGQGSEPFNASADGVRALRNSSGFSARGVNRARRTAPLK
jgi:hypothetical protein